MYRVERRPQSLTRKSVSQEIDSLVRPLGTRKTTTTWCIRALSTRTCALLNVDICATRSIFDRVLMIAQLHMQASYQATACLVKAAGAWVSCHYITLSFGLREPNCTARQASRSQESRRGAGCSFAFRFLLVPSPLPTSHLIKANTITHLHRHRKKVYKPPPILPY